MISTKQTLKRSIGALLVGATTLAVTGTVCADVFTYKEPDAATEQIHKLDEQIQTLQSRLAQAESMLFELALADRESNLNPDTGNSVSEINQREISADLDPESRAVLSSHLDERLKFLGKVGNKNLVRRGGVGGAVLTLSDAEYQNVKAAETELITRSLLNAVLHNDAPDSAINKPSARDGLEARRSANNSHTSK